MAPYWPRRHTGPEYRRVHPSRGRAERQFKKTLNNLSKTITERNQVPYNQIHNKRQQSPSHKASTSTGTSEQTPEGTLNGDYYYDDDDNYDDDPIEYLFEDLIEEVSNTDYSPINTFIVGQLDNVYTLYRDQNQQPQNLSRPGFFKDTFSQTPQARIYERDLLAPADRRQIEIHNQNKLILKRLEGLERPVTCNRPKQSNFDRF